MTDTHYDAIVIGSGTSAYYCITGLNEAGRKVAVIDERPYGGTCALRGCQPKKYLVANAEAVAMAGHLVGKGIHEKPRTQWQALQALKNAFLDGKSEREVKDYQEEGIATYAGRATLVGRNEVEIDDGQRLTAEHIVLATGATPRVTAIPGSEHVRDSEYFLNLTDLPERIVFIGGGYISFEFAHVAAQAGSRVTILHRSARPLKAFDEDMVKVVLEASEAGGISVVTEESPVRIEEDGTGYRLTGSTGTEYGADLIIEATGRTPNLSVLEGGHGEVDHSPRGIAVNEHLQSVSNPQVYAIGDCAATEYQLAPVADEEGKVAAHNIIHENGGEKKTVDYSVVPSAVFTIPSLAAVGLTEAQAAAQNLNYRVNHGSTVNWPSSKRIGEAHSGYKVLINNDDDTILGAHLVRHSSSEVINIFGLAIKHGIKASHLAEFLWAYPTYTSDLKHMVE